MLVLVFIIRTPHKQVKPKISVTSLIKFRKIYRLRPVYSINTDVFILLYYTQTEVLSIISKNNVDKIVDNRCITTIYCVQHPMAYVAPLPSSNLS